jgi:hypothetical protein
MDDGHTCGGNGACDCAERRDVATAVVENRSRASVGSPNDALGSPNDALVGGPNDISDPDALPGLTRVGKFHLTRRRLLGFVAGAGAAALAVPGSIIGLTSSPAAAAYNCISGTRQNKSFCYRSYVGPCNPFFSACNCDKVTQDPSRCYIDCVYAGRGFNARCVVQCQKGYTGYGCCILC